MVRTPTLSTLNSCLWDNASIDQTNAAAAAAETETRVTTSSADARHRVLEFQSEPYTYYAGIPSIDKPHCRYDGSRQDWKNWPAELRMLCLVLVPSESKRKRRVVAYLLLSSRSWRTEPGLCPSFSPDTSNARACEQKKINLRSAMIRRRHGEAAGPIGAANLARRCARPGIVEIGRV